MKVSLNGSISFNFRLYNLDFKTDNSLIIVFPSEYGNLKTVNPNCSIS